MARDKKKIRKYDVERLKKEFPGINDERLNICETKNIKLKAIFDDYLIQNVDYIKTQTELLGLLSPVLGIAHSISSRIKNADHLMEKIIRNSSEKKYGGLNEENYYKVIMDLIGFRVIILCKQDWENVHEFILKTFPKPPRYLTERDDPIKFFDELGEDSVCLAEQPKAYVTSGDDQSAYKAEDLIVDESKKNYSSVHYTIKYKDCFFEIQVRTLFEEAYLEFDHKIRYPNDKNNPYKNHILTILKSLAFMGDDLISFYNKYDCSDKYAKQSEKKQDTKDAAAQKNTETFSDFMMIT